LFAFAVAIGSGFIIGWPAARAAARIDLNTLLKEESRNASSDRTHRRVQRALMAAQIALALVLVTATILALKSYRNLHSVDPGFHADDVLAVRITLPITVYADGPALDIR
jgi:putative ABC transport system permease protein